MMSRSSMAREIIGRLDRFQRTLTLHGIDGALIVQKVDLYYLTGTDQDAHLWVPASGPPLLMVRKSMERAIEDASIETILSLSSLSEIPVCIREACGAEPRKVGLEMDVLPVKMYQAYLKLFPEQEMVDISPIIRGLRMVKSPHEIALIRKAAEMADRLYHKVPEFIRESETENDLALKAESFYRSQGHPGISRMRGFNMENIYGHIMAGPSGAVPSASPGPTGGTGLGPFHSQGAGRRKLRPNEPIIIDYTASAEGYLSDQARIFSIGELPENFQRAHQVMIQVQETVARRARPGVKASALYEIALAIVDEAGLSKGFMGYPQPVPFVAHGLGLELDEWPILGKNSDHILEAGMVIAMEPKVIFPGEGVVGIENTFVVTEEGLERLNQFPDGIVIIS